MTQQIKQAVNWNKLDDDFTLLLWEQNFMQIWSEKEISVSDDLMVWNQLSPKEKHLYIHIFGGLTLLDTQQGGEGMPLLQIHTPNLKHKSILGLMNFMEHVHAKSYSYIFTTIATNKEIDEVFQWVQDNPYLQYKANKISGYYTALLKKEVSKRELYMAYVASVFLESYLFYSGFFYPLYLSGQAKMTASGEIINLILRDESIHGVTIGLLAQQLYEELSEEDKHNVDVETIDLLNSLHENETIYTKQMYSEVGLEEDVLAYLRYNANRALMNLGREPYFVVEAINPIVENGLNTATKNHDIFSKKGTGYIKTVNIIHLSDDDFTFTEENMI